MESKALERLGVTNDTIEKGKGMKRLGVCDSDLDIESELMKHDGYAAALPKPARSKKESLTGFNEDQINREKGLKRLGATEKDIADEHARRASDLGFKARNDGLKKWCNKTYKRQYLRFHNTIIRNLYSCNNIIMEAKGTSNRALSRLGVSEDTIEKEKGMKRLGICDEDLNKESEISRHDGYAASIPSADPKKEERVIGFTDDQIKREKALKTLGTSEKDILDAHAKNVSELGYK